MKGKIQHAYKSRLLHRLRIIQGQLRGLESMISDEKYCVDVLNQSLAIQESLKSFDALMLENHLRTHVVGKLSSKKRDAIVKEMIRLYKTASK